MSKPKTEEKIEIGIGMIVQVTNPIDGKDDPWNHAVGHVQKRIWKSEMTEKLWGVFFTRSDQGELFWFWAKELSVVSELGTVESIDEGDLLGKAIDAMAHEIVAQAIEDLDDEYPGISKYTVIGSIAGGQTVIDCLEERMIEIIDGIDR
jgi:hypothetical protein